MRSQIDITVQTGRLAYDDQVASLSRRRRALLAFCQAKRVCDPSSAAVEISGIIRNRDIDQVNGGLMVQLWRPGLDLNDH